MMLRDYTTEELTEELRRRATGKVCTCGPKRREIVEHANDETFLPRTGCVTCDVWDGPPKLRNP